MYIRNNTTYDYDKQITDNSNNNFPVHPGTHTLVGSKPPACWVALLV